MKRTSPNKAPGKSEVIDNLVIDKTFAGGNFSLILILFIISILTILFCSLIIIFSNAYPGHSIREVIWICFMRLLDSGGLETDSGSWIFIIIATLLTLLGIILISALVGIIANEIERQHAKLRLGRTPVEFKNHVVILGWSSPIYDIIQQLATNFAAKNKPHKIVIFAKQPKPMMEQLISEKFKYNKNDPTSRELKKILKFVQIYVRSGNPLDIDDLEITNLINADEIIILSPEHDFHDKSNTSIFQDSDSETIKILLAVQKQATHQLEYHSTVREKEITLVADIQLPENHKVACSIFETDNKFFTPMLISSGDLIARLIAQSSCSTGLPEVITKLLDYANQDFEFYPNDSVKLHDNCKKMKFSDALLAFSNATVIGYIHYENTDKNNIKTHILPIDNPTIDLSKDDKLIIIAGDDNSNNYGFRQKQTIPVYNIIEKSKLFNNNEHKNRILILNWSWKAITIVNELYELLTPGSKIDIAVENNHINIQSTLDDLVKKNNTVKIGFNILSPIHLTNWADLDKLNISKNYDHVILLAGTGNDEQRIDARSIMTLLHLRAFRKTAISSGVPAFSIVSEILCPENRELLELSTSDPTHIEDDFIISEQLIAMLKAQVSQNYQVGSIYNEIFTTGGAEIYLRSAECFIELNKDIEIRNIIQHLWEFEEIFIGYRRKIDGYDIILNPQKDLNGKETIIRFEKGDDIVVIANKIQIKKKDDQFE
jgi:hypothetical protein